MLFKEYIRHLVLKKNNYPFSQDIMLENPRLEEKNIIKDIFRLKKLKQLIPQLKT